MSYRPITDTWILARCKYLHGVKYYGGYPGGFLERARALLGVSVTDPVLHVCGGMVRHYPYPGGFGPNDQTLDLDPATEPTFLQDAREPLPAPLCPVCKGHGGGPLGADSCGGCGGEGIPWEHAAGWPAVLIDRPYTEADAAKYHPGATALPPLNLLLKHGLQAVAPGGRVGLLDYLLPAPPRPEVVGFETRFVACMSIYVGFNNRVRCYSVFERLAVRK